MPVPRPEKSKQTALSSVYSIFTGVPDGGNAIRPPMQLRQRQTHLFPSATCNRHSAPLTLVPANPLLTRICISPRSNRRYEDSFSQPRPRTLRPQCCYILVLVAELAEDPRTHCCLEIAHEVGRPVNAQMLTQHHESGLFAVDKIEVHVGLAGVADEDVL